MPIIIDPKPRRSKVCLVDGWHPSDVSWSRGAEIWRASTEPGWTSGSFQVIVKKRSHVAPFSFTVRRWHTRVMLHEWHRSRSSKEASGEPLQTSWSCQVTWSSQQLVVIHGHESHLSVTWPLSENPATWGRGKLYFVDHTFHLHRASRRTNDSLNSNAPHPPNSSPNSRLPLQKSVYRITSGAVGAIKRLLCNQGWKV